MPLSPRNLRRSWRPSELTPAAGETTARGRAPAPPPDLWRAAQPWGDPRGARSCRRAVGFAPRGSRPGDRAAAVRLHAALLRGAGLLRRRWSSRSTRRHATWRTTAALGLLGLRGSLPSWTSSLNALTGPQSHTQLKSADVLSAAVTERLSHSRFPGRPLKGSPAGVLGAQACWIDGGLHPFRRHGSGRGVEGVRSFPVLGLLMRSGQQ
ncbi:hypothetical protein NDU88_004455 [Pleurodeles waltl]|uniref:Uncharacterized protein n=1 Tax=Pleurodeles waltl TaxID=8319 RepID=A0AAV7W7X3_PLEWA|nr:hypothetical protein NDU88_004455 [Pleurodeles waltl]